MSQDTYGPPLSDSALAGGTPHDPSPAVPMSPVAAVNHKRALLEQFVKFCIVGFSSTSISIGIVYLLKDYFHFELVVHNFLAGSPNWQHFVDSNHLWLQTAGTVGFIFGVTNGFIWNSRWTFPQKDASKRRQQCLRFFAVNVSGQTVNWIVTFILMQTMEGRGYQVHASIFGAIVVSAFWNFTLNRLWAFKH